MVNRQFAAYSRFRYATITAGILIALGTNGSLGCGMFRKEGVAG